MTFGQQPLISSSVSRVDIAPNLKKFRQGVIEILRTQVRDGLMDNPNVSCHGYRWRGSLKKKSVTAPFLSFDLVSTVRMRAHREAIKKNNFAPLKLTRITRHPGPLFPHRGPSWGKAGTRVQIKLWRFKDILPLNRADTNPRR